MKLLDGTLHLKINVKVNSGTENGPGAYGSDSAFPVLSTCQLDITNKVIDVLIPTEDITNKSISADNALI